MLRHSTHRKPAAARLSLSALWLGERDDAEFAESYALLARRTSLQAAATLAQAAQIVAATPGLSLAVVAQASPGQHPAEALEPLERLAPLVRWVHVRGSWCSGLQRGPLALPTTLRLPWHRAARWFARELDAVAAGRAPAWSAPLTAREDETRFVPRQSLDLGLGATGSASVRPRESRPQQSTGRASGTQISRGDQALAGILASRGPPSGAGGLAVVVTQQHAWGEALRDLLVAEGFACSRYLHGEPLRTAGAALLVWEADEAASPAAFAAARQALGGPAALVVAPWLTGAARQVWLAAGADEVLQQPFELVDFADALAALLARAS